MGITYVFDEALGIARVRWDGAISIQVVRAFWPLWREVLETRGFPPTLVDGRTCRVQFTGAELERAVDSLLRQGLERRGRRIALLASGPVQFGTARQFQAFFGELGEAEVFTDEAEALAWLKA